MKPTTKIRFTEPQIALVMRAHPNCNLERLTELSFEFDRAGKIVDCLGTIKDGRAIDHDYAGSGLARLRDQSIAMLRSLVASEPEAVTHLGVLVGRGHQLVDLLVRGALDAR